MRRLNASLFFLVVATLAQAEWQTVSTKDEPSLAVGLGHRRTVLQNSETGDRAAVDLAVFSAKSCKLRVIDNPDGESLADVMTQTNCVAGVNGGYFDPDFAPIGLRVVDGRQLKPLVRARLLTGVLVSSPRGVQILRLRELSAAAKADAAIECGPMIVDLGAAVRGLDDTRSARRTFAAVDQAGRGALGYCSDATLAGLATILSLPSVADFKVQRALNLDGGSSSAFWFKRKDASALAISEQKSVRDFVGVAPR